MIMGVSANGLKDSRNVEEGPSLNESHLSVNNHGAM